LGRLPKLVGLLNRRLFKVVCDLLSRKLSNHFEKQHRFKANISKKLKKSKQKKPIWRFVATLFKDFIGFLSPSNIAYPIDAIPPGCELDLEATGQQGVGSHSPK